MAPRERLNERVAGGGNYFAAPPANLQFIPSGCKLLDLVLGGGWAERRISNVVGNKSTGKTLIAIEAAANFIYKYPKGLVPYREAEAAFDEPYAGALGMPLERVDFGSEPIETVEDMFEDIEKWIKKYGKEPSLYIIDSLDALSDRGEMKRDIDEGTYGAEKAKKLSQLFRRLTSQMATANITLMIISQIRDKIGALIGKKTTRSGGRALDFYASQVITLDHIGRIKRTVDKVDRIVGVDVKAFCDKNKVSMPFRECEFPIMFGYGIDDVQASLDWLKSVDSLDLVEVDPGKIKAFARRMIEEPDHDAIRGINEAVAQRWSDIEQSFLPARRKYNQPEA